SACCLPPWIIPFIDMWCMWLRGLPGASSGRSLRAWAAPSSTSRLVSCRRGRSRRFAWCMCWTGTISATSPKITSGRPAFASADCLAFQNAHLGRERGAFEPQHVCGGFLVAVSPFERLPQDGAFDDRDSLFVVQAMIRHCDHRRRGPRSLLRPGGGQRKIGGTQEFPLAAQRDSHFDCVFELTDISGPRICAQTVDGIVIELLQGQLLCAADFGHEVVGQKSYVGRPLAQARHLYGNHV